MLGLPLWIGFAAPFVACAIMFAIIWRGKRGHPNIVALFGGLVLVLIGIGLMAAASGQADENRVRDECAKHDMAPFRVAFGHSQCIDPKTHQLRAFEDVR